MSGLGSRAVRWTVGMALLFVVGAARENIRDLFHRGSEGDVLEAANQRLQLEFDGQSVDLSLERLNVYLTESEGEPEIFQLAGPNVSLAGRFPADIRVDYEENWSQLLSRSIPVSASMGSDFEPSNSTITIPGVGTCRILGGTLTIDSVGQNRDAETPLRGTCTLRCMTPRGEISVRGSFSVLGTTWG